MEKRVAERAGEGADKGVSASAEKYAGRRVRKKTAERTGEPPKKTVGVFFGGMSNEAEISVITGMYAVNLLRGTRWQVLPVYLPPEGGMLLGNYKSVSEFSDAPKGTPVTLADGALVREGKRKPLARIDVALNCCHGGMGEDGTLAALLRWNNIPSASPAQAESAVFMDKSLTKIAARGLDIPVAPALTVSERSWRADALQTQAQVAAFGYPVVVKPARLGSSIGLTVAHGEEELADALGLAFTLDDKALIERYFPEKRDINCAACRMGGEVMTSPCEEVFSAEELLSYAEKYQKGKGSQCPADLPASVSAQIGADTRRLYEAFGMRGVVRADFLVVGEQVYFNELNIVPGSLAGYLFGHSLSQIRDFFAGLLDEALREPTAKKQTIRTGILRENVFSGAKGCKRRGNFV